MWVEGGRVVRCPMLIEMSMSHVIKEKKHVASVFFIFLSVLYLFHIDILMDIESILTK